MLKFGFFSLTIAILAACGVYGMKNRVQILEKDLVMIERKIEKERLEIKRLKAEWATLSHPERLARLSADHLGLKPAEPRQIVRIADIPLRDGPMRDGPALDGETGPALVSSITPLDRSLLQ